MQISVVGLTRLVSLGWRISSRILMMGVSRAVIRLILTGSRSGSRGVINWSVESRGRVVEVRMEYWVRRIE
jgi:hypothetical protein